MLTYTRAVFCMGAQLHEIFCKKKRKKKRKVVTQQLYKSVSETQGYQHVFQRCFDVSLDKPSGPGAGTVQHEQYNMLHTYISLPKPHMLTLTLIQ